MATHTVAGARDQITESATDAEALSGNPDDAHHLGRRLSVMGLVVCWLGWVTRIGCPGRSEGFEEGEERVA